MFDDARNLVIRVEIGRIGHADLQRLRVVFENNRAKTPRLGLGQLLHHLGLDVVVLEIDVRNLQLLGQRFRYFLFGDVALLNEYATEFAAAALLFIERELELFGRQQILLNKNFAEANFFRAGHAWSIQSVLVAQNSHDTHHFMQWWRQVSVF